MSSPQQFGQPYCVASALPPLPANVVSGTGFALDASTNQGMNQLQVGLGPVQQYYGVGVQGNDFQTAYASGFNYGFGSQQVTSQSYVGGSGVGHAGSQTSTLFGLHDTKTQADSVSLHGGLASSATRNIGIGGTDILSAGSGFKAGPQGMSMDAKMEVGGKTCIDFKCTNCACCCSCTDLASCANTTGSALKAIFECLGECLKCTAELIGKPRR